MTPTMEQAQTAASENLKLQVRRIIRAPRSRVYEAWTKPERIQQWFGRGEKNVESVSVDPRLGGAYRIAMHHSCGDIETGSAQKDGPIATGNYTEIIPDKKLVFTWTGDWNPTETTLVTVELADVSEGTEVTLTHERFTSAASRDNHEQGWTGSFANLAKFCEA